MRNETEIKELKKYLVDDFYSTRITQQKEDQLYYIDNFLVPLVKNKDFVIRTGRARRIVDKPIEHIISLTPQFFRDSSKKGQAEADARVASEGNRWVRKLSSENPNPFWEHARNAILRGEAWIYVVHNDSLPIGWQEKEPEAMPVIFNILDPLIVFADPSESEVQGVPPAVIISYERVVNTLLQRYPQWTTNTKKTGKVPFFMYLDKDTRYIEAEDKTILVDENPYGFVPCVHSYSGFGRSTGEGDPATLAMGRLTPLRQLLRNECTIESDFAYIINKFAYKTLDIWVFEDVEIDKNIGTEYNAGGGNVNITRIPKGSVVDRDTGLPPPQEVILYRASIKQELDMEDPPSPAGTTGRHEDIIYSSWWKRFAPLADNSAHAFATAFGLSFKICETFPDWIPPNLHKEDIGGRYDCRIELKATDPIAEDRKRLLGRSLLEAKQIDMRTNLVKYQGYTEEEAREIIARIMVDGVTIYSPTVSQILGARLTKELGLEREVEALKQQGLMQEEIQKSGIGSQGGEPRTLNIQTPKGMEEADLALMQRGERRSPMEMMR